MDDVDPEVLAVRAAQAAMAPGFDLMTMPIAEARAVLDRLAISLNDPLPALDEVESFNIPESGQGARRYRPERARPDAAILYVHGGGWSSCGLDTHDRLLRLLALGAGCELIATSYRLAPEHPFPAALDDVRAAWRELGGARRTVVAGDSAGANLALALALGERDAGRPPPAGLALSYGCYAPGLATASRTRFDEGYGLTPARMDWYWANYLGGQAPSPLAAPLTANLSGLPPAFVGIAGCDILADENRLLAERLAAGGSKVTVKTWPGAVHGFLLMTRDAAIARAAVADLAAAVTGLLAT
jgi:acetyl esterase